MSDPVRADLFVEDRAQEAFVGELVRRIAGDERVPLIVQTRSARGGVSRVFHEFRTFQTLIEKQAFAGQQPVVEPRVAPRAARRPADKA